MVSIAVNGQVREVPEGMSVAGLLQFLGLENQPLVVEHNLKALLKSEWPEVSVAGGDQIEFIRVVAGG